MASECAPEPMREIAPTVTTDRGNPLARWLLRLFSWRVICHGTPPGCGILIAARRTSNWDFVVGIVAKWATGLPVLVLSKGSLFRRPLPGRFMRACGRIPADRSSPHGVIANMAEPMAQANRSGERWWLAITPEGTRKRSEDGWRSSFYPIAVAAQVPIALAYFNFERKKIGVTTFLQPSGNANVDLPQIARWSAKHAVGWHPELATPVRLKRSR